MTVPERQFRESLTQAAPDASELRGNRRETRILLIEDSPEEAELTIRQIRPGGIPFVWHRVDSEAELRYALHHFRPHIVLSDFTLPGFDGLSALKIVKDELPDLPFVFVSGTIGEERAIEALRRGAVDYVLKSNLARLAPAITRALADASARLERRRQEAQITHLTRVLRMLSGINSVVLRIRDRQELFDEACRLAVTVGGYSTVLVLLTQPGASTLQAIAGSGVDVRATDQLRAQLVQSASRDSNIIRQILKSGIDFVCNDTAELDAADAVNALLQRAAVQSVVALPLLLDETAIGILMLIAPNIGTISTEELQMLREVSANLSFALQYLQRDNAVHFLSYFDPQTGLAKRSLFCERLARLLERASGGAQPRHAVAVVDVEQLSVINDSFGRHMGDRLLQHVAERLRRHFPNTELLAQFAGGTFAIALDTGSSRGDLVPALQGQLASIFGQPFELPGCEIPVVIKSGLALHTGVGMDAAALVQNAEAALHNARASGQRHLHFSIEQHSEVVARLALEHRLRTAIDKRQFELHYQAKVNAQTLRIEGVEGLIRWRQPDSGLIAPGAFLPLLESTGLIVEVGDWVLEQAAVHCQEWRRLGLPGIRIAVNVSPLELGRAQFAQRFLELTERWADANCGLDLEITEGALLNDSAAESKLKRLRTAGIRIAIDDFGTGYSSLSRLSDLPIDTLKIDRTFINRLPDDHAGRTLVSTIITLAHAFGMTVVAEGVETRAQLDTLREMGCDQLQGYLLSRPLSADALVALLETGKGQLTLPT